MSLDVLLDLFDLIFVFSYFSPKLHVLVHQFLHISDFIRTMPAAASLPVLRALRILQLIKIVI